MMIGVCSGIFFGLGLVVGPVGCAFQPAFLPAQIQSAGSPDGPWVDGQTGLRVIVRGDWDDVDAAAEVGVSRGEAAILSSRLEQGRREYELVSIQDEPGILIASLAAAPEEAAGPPGPGVPIELTCRMGRSENRARERVILLQTARRLKDLAGVDVRPIR
jgi:hypothetical protein